MELGTQTTILYDAVVGRLKASLPVMTLTWLTDQGI